MPDTLPAHAALAAIDMGSNSFRLELGQLDGTRYRRIDYLKETVRLGGGLDENGLLTEEAMLRGLSCLSRFAHRLQGVAPWQVRAVATQTLREARNRAAELGCPVVETIAGKSSLLADHPRYAGPLGVTGAGAANVVVSEMHYNPPGSADTGEFVEIMNVAAQTIDLTGVRFDSGIRFSFHPGTTLEAGERAVVAATAADEKVGRDIVAIDVSEHLVLTDVFLIVTANNERQVKAVVDAILDHPTIKAVSFVGSSDMARMAISAPPITNDPSQPK